MTQVVVVGCGGIGLPLAVALASRGCAVTGVDVDAAKVEHLRRGELGLNEAGLEPAMLAAMARATLSFETATAPADHARAWIIAVPTPVGADQTLDETPIQTAFASVLAAARTSDLVALRSTLPVGYTRKLAAQAQGRGLMFASCPDRSLSGSALTDQFSIPHIVGGLDEAAAAAAVSLFSTLGRVVRVSSPEAAEALKLFTNVWRDSRFGIANQFALYCAAAGLDFGEIRTAGADGFGRFDIPRAGPVGGPCLDKDVHLLAQSAAASGAGMEAPLAARRANLAVIPQVVGAILADLKAQGGARRVAVLGLAFKGAPETADRRGSVGVAVLEALGVELGDGAVGWDPCEGPAGGGAEAARGASVVVLANDHPALNDATILADCAPGALIYDLCGVMSGPVRPDLRLRRLGAEGAA